MTSIQKLVLITNQIDAFEKAGTTLSMATAAVKLGLEVHITDVTSIRVDNDGVHCHALAFGKSESQGASKSGVIRIDASCAVFVRTSPGRDPARGWAHRLTIEALSRLSEEGIHVVNNPRGLLKASSKLYSTCLPKEWVPRTRVCHRPEDVLEFFEHQQATIVIKPLLGSQGRDVFFLGKNSAVNFRQIVEVVGRSDYVVVQEYLSDAVNGDLRVLVCNGKVLRSGDAAVAIRRRPADGDMRSNVSLGGNATLEYLDETTCALAELAAVRLQKDGIAFAGLDIVGGKIIEVNVFSPGGLHDLDRYLGTDVTSEVVEALVQDM